MAIVSEGLLANLQERSFSAAGWPELCPVIWAFPGGWLLIMRRARQLTMKEFDSLIYSEWIKGDSNDYIIPVEEKLDSFGMLDGKIVAVDYGN